MQIDCRNAETLYIPLCFYFICKDSLRINIIDGPLHSIMLLLYRCKRYWSFGQWAPLHSIMLLLYLFSNFCMSVLLYLYIPLCFYFIAERNTDRRDPDPFTFHYASTLSDPEPENSSALNQFSLNSNHSRSESYFRSSSTISANLPILISIPPPFSWRHK